MNKSVVTNLIALAVVVGGYFSPVYDNIIVMTGLFALSGGVTNWLAVHMLFERVPLLYGSGVIPNRFEEFKAGIKHLMMQEFFTPENIEHFLKQNHGASVAAISARINFDRVFEGLMEAIEESAMGGMLKMLGGRKLLQPLKEPVVKKIQEIIEEWASSDSGEDKDSEITAMLTRQVEQIIDSRLEELTPQKVKEIVQDMIRRHLGWLVVWGGVFGGLIGLVVSIFENWGDLLAR